MSGTVTIEGLSATEPAGERVLGPLSIPGTVIVGATDAMSLVAGDNTITVPTGSIGVVIVPPTAGTAALKYRTNLNAGDGGLPISPTYPFMHTFPSPAPTSIIINAASGQSSFLTLWFW